MRTSKLLWRTPAQVRVRAVAPTSTAPSGDPAARAADEHEANDRVLVLRIWRVHVRVWGT